MPSSEQKRGGGGGGGGWRLNVKRATEMGEVEAEACFAGSLLCLCLCVSQFALCISDFYKDSCFIHKHCLHRSFHTDAPTW